MLCQCGSKMKITETSVLDSLLKAELLCLRDLLSLGATCKALHARIRTGDLPKYLEYELLVPGARTVKQVCSSTRLVPRFPLLVPLHAVCLLSSCSPDLSALQEIQQLLSRVGGDLPKLAALPLYLPHLQLIPGLIHLDLVVDDDHVLIEEEPMCNLHHLTQLKELTVHDCMQFPAGVALNGLHKLQKLERLAVSEVLVSKLPSSLTYLHLHLELDEQEEFDAPLNSVLKQHRGELREGNLSMRILGGDTAQLSQVASLRNVSVLTLRFFISAKQDMKWCPGFFTRLQVLVIDLIDVLTDDSGPTLDEPIRPCWDLLTCTSLQILSLVIDGPSTILRLDQICNVRCPLVIVKTSDEPRIAATFRCTSWEVKKEVIRDWTPQKEPMARTRISAFSDVVIDMVGAVIHMPMLSELWLDGRDWSHMLCAQKPERFQLGV